MNTKAKVILLFAVDVSIIPLAEALLRRNFSAKTWIASEAWVDSQVLVPRFVNVFETTIGTALPTGNIPGFRNFLLNIRPTKGKFT